MLRSNPIKYYYLDEISVGKGIHIAEQNSTPLKIGEINRPYFQYKKKEDFPLNRGVIDTSECFFLFKLIFFILLFIYYSISIF